MFPPVGRCYWRRTRRALVSLGRTKVEKHAQKPEFLFLSTLTVCVCVYVYVSAQKLDRKFWPPRPCPSPVANDHIDRKPSDRTMHSSTQGWHRSEKSLFNHHQTDFRCLYSINGSQGKISPCPLLPFLLACFRPRPSASLPDETSST